MQNKFFNSKYPIVEAAMVYGSDLKLALSCQDAGVFPSLVIPYWEKIGNDFNYDLVNDTLKEYIKASGNSDIILAIGQEDFFDKKLIKIIKGFHISHIEPLPKHDTIPGRSDVFGKNYHKALSTILKDMLPIKLMWRTKSPSIDPTGGINLNNDKICYCIKGGDAAGFGGTLPTEELFKEQKRITPNAIMIPYGGIGTPQQVKTYLKNGAVAVAVGTLFAASAESPLSIETKNSMIKKNKNNITKFQDTRQNALILGKQEEVINDHTDWNRTTSFKKGLLGDGQSGHIYVGKGIDYISSIRTVKEVTEYLISEL